MARTLLVVLLAVIVLGWPGVQAQRQTSSNGTQAELSRARSIGLERLRSAAARKGIHGPDDLRVSRVNVDRHAMAHTRVQQYVGAIPVWTGEAIAHMTPAGVPFAETDDLLDGVSVDTTPLLTPGAAIDIAVSDYGCAACLTAPPLADLWILRNDGIDHLVYRVRLTRLRASRAALPVRFVDAHGGHVVKAYDDLQSATGSSLYSGNVTIGTTEYQGSGGPIYAMENLKLKLGTLSASMGVEPLPSPFSFLFNDLLDADDVWNAAEQRAAVDAHYGAESYLRYLLNVHGRNGLDGFGGPGVVTPYGGGPSLLSQFVHYPGAVEEIAAWITPPPGRAGVAVFGDGDGIRWNPGVTLDVVGHELTHGLTNYTAGLIGEGESGALKESWADVFGAMLERFVRGESANTWLNAEEAFTPATPGDALRYMDNPHLARSGIDPAFPNLTDPDHYSERYAGANDDGGVHTNAGIANKAFYLVAKGGGHHLGGTMTGIGADDAARIWFLALTEYMTSGSDFARAREATMLAAGSLYGVGSPEQQAVSSAWCMVGVGDAGCAVVDAISVTLNQEPGGTRVRLEYSDSLGAADLEARVRFGASDLEPGTCTISYNAATGVVRLLDDAGSGWTEGTIGNDMPLSNSQCILNPADMSATPPPLSIVSPVPRGLNLSIEMFIEFAPSFAGPNVYMAAASLSTNVDTGWVLKGTWTPNPAQAVLSAISVTPNAGIGARPVFTLLYSDSLGALDLKWARMRVGEGAAWTCSARYSPKSGAVQLLDDAGAMWTTGKMGGGTLSNSQCTLNLAGSSATVNGTSLTLALSISFAPTFSGPKNIYMLGVSASTTVKTGWVQRGTWTPYPGPVDIDTLTPTVASHSSRALAINANGQVVGFASIFVDGRFQSRAFSWTQATGMVLIGTLGSDSLAYDVSDNGKVVGYSARAGTPGYHAFLWTQAGGMVDLGTLGGTTSQAWAVNDSGQVVGQSQVAGDLEYHAFSWTAAGGMVDLGTLGSPSDRALDINASGQVVGVGTFARPGGGTVLRPFSWTQSGGLVALTSDDFAGEAIDVNDLGQVVGSRELIIAGFRYTHAFRWSAAGGMVDLGTLGGARSFATAVSDGGHVVGYSDATGGLCCSAFSWTPNGGMVDLGTIAGNNVHVPSAVNRSGQVVGQSYTQPPASGPTRPFLWTKTGGMTDLGTLGGTNGSATDVNDACQAVGYSNSPVNNVVHATLWTVGTCPPEVQVEAISVSPATGEGWKQTFSLQYLDSLGAADLSIARIRFGASSNSTAGTCTLDFDATTGLLRMQDDAGAWLPPIPIGTGSLANSQCRLTASSMSTPSATNLTLVLDLTFAPGFAGTKNIYMQARSADGTDTGWQLRGAWSVPPYVVETISVTPGAGATGLDLTQRFAFAYSDSLGAADLKSARVRFGTTNAGPLTCTFDYDATVKTIRLMDDAGTFGPAVPLGRGALSNGQCTLNLGSSAATSIDNSLILVLDITFAPTFYGSRNIYMRATGSAGSGTGWLQRGTLTVPLIPLAAEAQAVVPDAGMGATQAFTLYYWATLGATNISSARVRFSASNDPRTCTVRYKATSGVVELLSDAGNWTPGTLGSGSTLSNSQCSLNLAASSATLNANDLILVLDIAFDASFAGPKNIDMRAVSGATGANTGWLRRGTWTVTP